MNVGDKVRIVRNPGSHKATVASHGVVVRVGITGQRYLVRHFHGRKEWLTASEVRPEVAL